tara:strand:+ start:298 stop:495 length:198 start_codon:yes stop_codon:yes gene_type:complete
LSQVITKNSLDASRMTIEIKTPNSGPPIQIKERIPGIPMIFTTVLLLDLIVIVDKIKRKGTELCG